MHTLLAWGTGVGKTAEALSLTKNCKRVLWITTKSLKKIGLAEECSKWGGDVAKYHLYTSDDVRLNKVPDDKFDGVVWDECHKAAGMTPYRFYKNKESHPKTSQTYQKGIELLSWLKPKVCVLMSASVVKNPMCVYALHELLIASGLQQDSWDWYKFRDQFYIEAKVGFRPIWIVRQNKSDLLIELAKTFGRTKHLKDVAYIPPQHFETINVGLTKEQIKAIDELDVSDPLVELQKRHQIEQGILVEDKLTFPETKIQAINHLYSQRKKIVVVCKFTAQIEMYKKFFKDAYIINGKTKNVSEVVQTIEKSDRCMLIIQCSMGVGMNLPSFDCMIFASNDYSPVSREQMEGRILRRNALKENWYYDLLAGDMDKAVQRSIKNKKKFSEKLYAQEVGEGLRF
jgi:superfamily II DNA or RNA helicase